ncbi:unnamed protein product [Angiostrongylus costaricensis]|uniref:Bestrophin homolog n=1 Tax=Angiostrongylus costaricensis TaxID=334426 RepID=A0A0R3PIE3_ANGCS|nr:unnamed protein product [Angiostrongylus costaricensis]
MLAVFQEISKFRHGLAALLKYDWVPVPLVYPQVIFLAVRVYFVICLFGRQFIVTGGNPSGVRFITLLWNTCVAPIELKSLYVLFL